MTRQADLPADLKRAVRRKLLRWYDSHARDLPWRRRGGNAYAQWVAEIMLQQTQVETVIPYYERFLERFPTVEALARASQDALMHRWQGLGYYRRAMHLHRAAKRVVADGGEIPDSVDGLKRLPGIGPYTAGAVASIAFDRRAAAVDGNVIRVLTRLFNITDTVSRPDTIRRIWRIAEELLPTRRCGDFNQAWMDLGATVCVPGRPRCEQCPLADVCEGHCIGNADILPVQRAARGVPEVKVLVAVIRCNGSFLMTKRPVGGLWGGLWEFPNRDYATTRDRTRTLRNLMSDFGIQSLDVGLAGGVITHRLTHRLMRFESYFFEVSHRAAPPKSKWVRSSRLGSLPMSTAQRRVLAHTVDSSAGAECGVAEKRPSNQ